MKIKAKLSIVINGDKGDAFLNKMVTLNTPPIVGNSVYTGPRGFGEHEITRVSDRVDEGHTKVFLAHVKPSEYRETVKAFLDGGWEFDKQFESWNPGE